MFVGFFFIRSVEERTWHCAAVAAARVETLVGEGDVSGMRRFMLLRLREGGLAVCLVVGPGVGCVDVEEDVYEEVEEEGYGVED